MVGAGELEPDTNAVYSRLTAGPGKDSGDIKYLGTFPTWAGCVAAAKIGAGHKGAANYHSLVWHGALAGPYHAQCFGVAGKEWKATRQRGVTSAKGPGAGSAPEPPGPPAPTPSGAPCHDASGCSYNGVCKAGKCACAPQFAGEACERFNFAPLDLAKGSGLRTVDSRGLQVSSWGGSVHLADDGKYHMWAAEMTEGVGIKAWITNSQVVHAVADTPSAPHAFTRKEVVAPVFAHEPTVSRAPTGEWVSSTWSLLVSAACFPRVTPRNRAARR